MGELARGSSTTTTTTSSSAGSPQSMDEFYRQQRTARSDSVDSVDSMTSGDESSGPSRRSRRMTLRDNGAAFLGSISQRFHKKDPTREQLQQQSAYHQHQQRLSHHRRKPVVLLYDRAQTKSHSSSNNQLASDDEHEDDHDAAAAQPFDVLIAMADRTSTASTTSSASTPAMPTAPAHSARQPLSSSYSATGSRIPRPPRSSHGQTKYDVEWRRDQDYTACHICAVPFTKLSRRRHHCRLCGEIICGACSPDQVQVMGLFPAPKRSCVACFTLLQLMMHEGDPRVRWLDAAAAAQVFPPQVVAATTRATAHSSTTPVAAQTPRYHDRKGEMRRVAAAGTKSKRRGSTQVDLVVISSKWLRQWLAFTRTEGHGGVNADDGDLRSTYYVRRRIESADSSNNNTFEDEDAPPPGPIVNLHLLEMRRGQLMQRPGLVRGKQTPGQPQDDAGSDYQLIPSDVWDVLQRLYGGGPRIRVHANREGSQRLEWVVEVEPMLTSAAGPLSIPAIVQTSLLHRHHRALAPVISSAPSPSNEFSSSNHLFRRSSMARISGASSSSAASPVNSRQSQSWRHQHQQPPRSAPHYQQQYHEQPMDLRELDTTAAVPSNQQEEQEEVEKAASSAASAFAVAMKQARLDAQKALDERSSRVYT